VGRKMNKLSAFIITKNEENKIERTLKNIRDLVDEIVIIDGYSTDKTCKIAKKYGARIIKNKPNGTDKDKNLGIRECKNEWILDLDADEILYPETKKEIKEVLKNPNYDGYFIKRDEFFLGKKVMEVKLIRLYRKSKAHYEGYVHEVLKIDGKVGMLKSHFKHEQYKYEPISVFVEKKINRYSDMEIKKLEENGIKLSRAKTLWLMFFEPLKYFFGLLFYKGTIRAGIEGIMYAKLFAFYRFLIYLKYYEKYYAKK